MEFGLLGPFEATHRRARIDVRGRTDRKILSMLLLSVGHAVSVGALEDALWPESAPATARRQVRNRVAALRRTLARAGEDPIESVDDGYRIPHGAVYCDVTRFADRHRDAVHQARNGDEPAAIRMMDNALRLWRGPALMGLTGRFFDSAATRLEETRLAAIEARNEWRLRLDQFDELVPELAEHVAAQPYRARMLAQFMWALHCSGRTPQALAEYGSYRRRLADDLGITPGRGLRDTYLRILRDDIAG